VKSISKAWSEKDLDKIVPDSGDQNVYLVMDDLGRRARRSPDWIKVKNPKSQAMVRAKDAFS